MTNDPEVLGNDKKRSKLNEALEAMGLAAFQSGNNEISVMREGVPDSSGLSEEEIAALPEYVRNYRCGTSFENGDPYCRTDKFTKWGCEKRIAQTSWHPGL